MKQFMHMNRGNTLTEYSMILGLLAVLSLASLSLLGKSTSDLLGGFRQVAANSPILERLFGQESSGSNDSGNLQRTWAASGSGLLDGASSGIQALSLNRAVSSSGEPLLRIQDGMSSGVNATSLDGDKKVLENTALKTLALSKQVQSLADKLPEGSEKMWLTYDVIPRLMSLAAAEGYAAEIPGLHNALPSTAYSSGAALTDIAEIQNQLTYKSKIYSYVLSGEQAERFASPSPELEKAVVGILSQAIQGSKTFVPEHTSTSPSWNIGILKAYNYNLAPLQAITETPGYQSVVANIKSAQADGSINQNAPTANTAAGADTLQGMAHTLSR